MLWSYFLKLSSFQLSPFSSVCYFAPVTKFKNIQVCLHTGSEPSHWTRFMQVHGGLVQDLMLRVSQDPWPRFPARWLQAFLLSVAAPRSQRLIRKPNVGLFLYQWKLGCAGTHTGILCGFFMLFHKIHGVFQGMWIKRNGRNHMRFQEVSDLSIQKDKGWGGKTLWSLLTWWITLIYFQC